MFIKKIRVKNFRSLLDISINLNNSTAIVGSNDSGKSNILRALNLFFNGETEIGQILNFEKDYCQSSRRVHNKAKEISIEITLSSPQSYGYKGDIVWVKKFRKDFDGPYYDEVHKDNGTPFGKNEKNEYWARHLYFEYVPAVRGSAFFLNLKRRLHNTLAETVETEIKTASEAFLKELRRELSGIEDNVHGILNMSTEFALPQDLGEFFETLEFKTKDSTTTVPLQQRGDGIQSRHIPIILKFISDQRKKNSTKGKPLFETIWGYEEPENNLELLRQIDLAKDLFDAGKSVQVLITTHSPAFYHEAVKNSSLVAISKSSGITNVDHSQNQSSIDSSLGLMSFIEPHIAEAKSQFDELSKSLSEVRKESPELDHNILFVEGESDQIIIDATIKKLDIEKNFIIKTRIGGGAGTNWVVNRCIARCAIPESRSKKTAVLLDSDDSGRAAQRELDECMTTLRIDSHKPKIFMTGKSGGVEGDIRAIKSGCVNIEIETEELLGVEYLKIAKEKGWTKLRNSKALLKNNSEIIDLSTTLNDEISSRIPDEDHQLIIFNQIDDLKKIQFARFYEASVSRHDSKPPPNIERLVKSICNYFSN